MARAIEVRGLRFGYTPDRPLLDGIDLSVPAGSVFCILGPNGSGKSTLLRCILGIQHGATGSVHICGEPLHEMSERERARRVAYVPQHGVTGFPYNVADMVLMGRTAHLPTFATPSARDREAVAARLDQMGIAHLGERPFNAVSGGERQLALIARALVQDTPTIVLDEPTASLDFGNQMHILEVIRSLASDGRAVVLTTHTPDHAFFCASDVALLQGGRVLAHGKPEDVVTGEHLSTLYGIDVQVAEITTGPSPGDRRRVCVPLLRASSVVVRREAN